MYIGVHMLGRTRAVDGERSLHTSLMEESEM